MPSLLISLGAGLGLLLGLLGGTLLAVSQVHLPKPVHAHVLRTSEAKVDLSTSKNFDDFSKVASELDSWRRELTEKNNKALLLDAELARREQLLQAERVALDHEREKLSAVQKDIESRLIKIKENEVPRLEELATLYSTMKPEDAVTLLRALPPDQATRVLTVMKQKVQAKLLSAWMEKYPADKDQIAQITNDMVRTINEPASTEGTPASTPQ